jgi:hypothetical protein
MRLTKRGERAFIALLLIVGASVLALIYHLSISIHYTGEGYCYGSFIECYGQEGEGKK